MSRRDGIHSDAAGEAAQSTASEAVARKPQPWAAPLAFSGQFSGFCRPPPIALGLLLPFDLSRYTGPISTFRKVKTMQKKLIALAVAGLVSGGAFAQTNVTLSGQVKMSFESASGGGCSAVGCVNPVTRTRVNDQTSSLKFNAEESLGGGMKAGAQIEMDMFADTVGTSSAAAVMGARNSGVYVDGGFGRVLLGRWDTHYLSHAPVDFNGLGDTPLHMNSLSIIGSNNSVAASFAGGRLGNVLSYISPKFSGFGASLTYSAGSESTSAAVAGGTKGRSWTFNPSYTNGPIAVTYSYLTGTGDAAAGATATKQRADRLGFAYSFPMGLKAGLIWDKNRINVAGAGDSSRTAWSLPISYAMGAHTFSLTLGKANSNSGTVIVGATNDSTGASFAALGWNYALSKRTGVNLNYAQLNNQTNATYDFWTRGVGNVVAGVDPRIVSVGLRHTF